jgi:hypothetical protein
MVRRTRSLAAAIPTGRAHRIEGAAHAAPFDAPAHFVELIADTITDRDRDDSSNRGWMDREAVHQGRRRP